MYSSTAYFPFIPDQPFRIKMLFNVLMINSHGWLLWCYRLNAVGSCWRHVFMGIAGCSFSSGCHVSAIPSPWSDSKDRTRVPSDSVWSKAAHFRVKTTVNQLSRCVFIHSVSHESVCTLQADKWIKDELGESKTKSNRSLQQIFPTGAAGGAITPTVEAMLFKHHRW